jgi:hypothetical protein
MGEAYGLADTESLVKKAFAFFHEPWLTISKAAFLVWRATP